MAHNGFGLAVGREFGKRPPIAEAWLKLQKLNDIFHRLIINVQLGLLLIDTWSWSNVVCPPAAAKPLLQAVPEIGKS